MTYVDPLLACVPNKQWRWTHSCHLFADTLEELHAFARKIGLKRQWFQDHPSLKHYDLTPKRREAAVKAGVVELSRADSVMKWRELRKKSAQEPPALF